MASSYSASGPDRPDAFPILGPTTRTLPIHVLGDSHTLTFRNTIVSDEATGQRIAARVRYFCCTPATFYSETGGFHPDLLSGLEHEGLLRAGRATHFSWEAGDLRIGYSTGLSQLAPLIVVSCGDEGLRSHILPELKDEKDCLLPDAPTYRNSGLPVVPQEVMQRLIEQHMAPLLQGLSKLRSFGFGRTSLHCIVPPTTDDASFERVNGYHCPVNTRYKVALLCNRYLAAECRKRGIPFIDIWPDVTHNGYLRSEYELDGVHLAPSAVRFSLSQVVRLGAMDSAGLNFPRYELFYRLARGEEPGPDQTPRITAPVAPSRTGRWKSRCKSLVKAVLPGNLVQGLKSSALVGRILGRKNAESSAATPAQSAPTFASTLSQPPRLDDEPAWVGEAVAGFQQRLLTTIPIEPRLFQRWRSLLDFSQDVGNRHVSFDWAGNPVKPFNETMRSAELPQEVLDGVGDLFDGHAFNRFFESVLGCPIYVMSCRAFMSTPHQDDGVGPQAFHTDGYPTGLLRGVLYLTDVTPDAGPFEYRDAEGATHTMTAPAGTLLVFDANQLVHRGSPPRSETRQVLDFVFCARLPGQPMLVVSPGMNSFAYDPFRFSVRGMGTSPRLPDEQVALPPYDVAQLLPLTCYRPRDKASAAA